ncbi:hypothetical protein NXS19_012029 [Fusarium pseudograminearum]|nr:hypothetical protein NXS19_012029 [Fusarium pseudograminearum]
MPPLCGYGRRYPFELETALTSRDCFYSNAVHQQSSPSDIPWTSQFEKEEINPCRLSRDRFCCQSSVFRSSIVATLSSLKVYNSIRAVSMPFWSPRSASQRMRIR